MIEDMAAVFVDDSNVSWVSKHCIHYIYFIVIECRLLSTCNG